MTKGRAVLSSASDAGEADKQPLQIAVLSLQIQDADERTSVPRAPVKAAQMKNAFQSW